MNVSNAMKRSAQSVLREVWGAINVKIVIKYSAMISILRLRTLCLCVFAMNAMTQAAMIVDCKKIVRDYRVAQNASNKLRLCLRMRIGDYTKKWNS